MAYANGGDTGRAVRGLSPETACIARLACPGGFLIACQYTGEACEPRR
jgi:hypothetical protein